MSGRTNGATPSGADRKTARAAAGRQHDQARVIERKPRYERLRFQWAGLVRRRREQDEGARRRLRIDDAVRGDMNDCAGPRLLQKARNRGVALPAASCARRIERGNLLALAARARKRQQSLRKGEISIEGRIADQKYGRRRG